MSGELVELRPGLSSAPPPRATLRRAAQLDLERAEGFLLDLAAEFDREPTVARLSWLIGSAEAHLANLIEMVRGLANA